MSGEDKIREDIKIIREDFTGEVGVRGNLLKIIGFEDEKEEEHWRWGTQAQGGDELR